MGGTVARISGIADKFGDMLAAEGFFKGGEGWAEEGSMGKGNKISCISTCKGSVGMMGNWGANVEFPKS